MKNNISAFSKLKKLTETSKKELDRLVNDINNTINLITLFKNLFYEQNCFKDKIDSYKNYLKLLYLSSIIKRFVEINAIPYNENIEEYLLNFINDDLTINDFKNHTIIDKLNYENNISKVIDGVKKGVYIEIFDLLDNQLNSILQEIESSIIIHNKFANNITAVGVKNPTFNNELANFFEIVIYMYKERGLSIQDACQIIGNVLYINGIYSQKDNNESDIFTLALAYFDERGNIKQNSDVDSFEHILINLFEQYEINELVKNDKNVIIDKFMEMLINKNRKFNEDIENRNNQKRMLILKHKALSELKKYYADNKIIKECDIITFKNILSDADIDILEQNRIIKLMKNFIKSKEQLKFAILLNETDIHTYNEAIKLKGNKEVSFLLEELNAANELYLEGNEEEKSQMKQEARMILDRLSEIKQYSLTNIRRIN